MGRTKGSTLAVVGNWRRVIKPHEDWDEIDGFLIISSAFPFKRRGAKGCFITPDEVVTQTKARYAAQSSRFLISKRRSCPPSPPVPKVILRLKPPPSAPSPPPLPPRPPSPPPLPPLPPPSPPTKTFDLEEFETAIETERARYARYEAICDLAGVPSVRRPIIPPAKPRRRRRRRDHLHTPRPPRPPPIVVEARAPEPNMLAMGEVDLICWETMPPPTP